MPRGRFRKNIGITIKTQNCFKAADFQSGNMSIKASASKSHHFDFS